MTNDKFQNLKSAPIPTAMPLGAREPGALLDFDHWDLAILLISRERVRV
ncbi:MAG TPA: hypothetical protein VEU07_04515 [Candidatus Acidoferrum sp.]|nr:hypothetical protein [Candidatus Acidoferrum sp.]